VGFDHQVVPVFFLDTNCEENNSQDREISSQLYGGDNDLRIVQEIVLGIGGVKMLDQLGCTGIKTYHMNEGHAAFLTLELLAQNNNNLTAVKEKCVFTTHTPVPAGHDAFDYKAAEKFMGHYLPANIKELAGPGCLNMTLLALNCSRFCNGVAKKHGEVSRNMFPNYSITSITNGVHSKTWTAQSFQELYNKYLPGWQIRPEKFCQAFEINDQEVWEAHQTEKKRLLSYVGFTTGILMDPEILTIGFARRAATYKRGDLLFHDIERLVKICSGKVQFIFSSKAHPKDFPGKEVIKKIIAASKKIANDDVKIAFLPNYSMDIGALMTAGVDIWLNTPMRPREASGTSGMKATHNGVPNFSVLDGWWIEGHEEDITGWGIGPDPEETSLIENDNHEDAESLYNKLEHIIIPKYYHHREKWLRIMKNTICKNASYFNTHRMVKEYAEMAYALKEELQRV
jgi:starch phosphorylase